MHDVFHFSVQFLVNGSESLVCRDSAAAAVVNPSLFVRDIEFIEQHTAIKWTEINTK